jgi:iron complex outermembrane receptor protein
LLNLKVTVASRTPESIEDAPASLTVFTREQIQRMAVSTLEDLLNYVPGFQVTGDTGLGRISRIAVRGLFSTVSSGVLLLHDGVPDWEPLDGSSWMIGRHVMLNDVERVEVMRGPGSTMWGTNASSAVVNIVTVKNRDTASVGYGTIGRRELSANFHSEVVPGLRVSGSVQAYADNGFTFNNYADSFGVTGNIKDPLSQYTATIRGEYKGLTLTVHSSGARFGEFVEFTAASPLNRTSIDRYNADLASTFRAWGAHGSCA